MQLVDLELLCYPALTHIRKLKGIIYLNLKLDFQIVFFNPEWIKEHKTIHTNQNSL